MARGGRIILSAGGTGGHMFPAQALAEALIAQGGWEVVLSTDTRGMRFADGFPKAVKRVHIGAASPAQGTLFKRLGAAWRLFFALGRMVFAYLWVRPRCVVGFGGYASFPALAAAWLLRIPRVLHEQNACAGRVNRLFAHHVQGFAYAMTIKGVSELPHAVECGNPVRDAVMGYKNAPYISFRAEERESLCNLLVFGGSQGAKILSERIPEAIGLLPNALRLRLRICHQVPSDACQKVQELYDALCVKAEIAPFFNDMPARMAKAHCIISRAGASSLAEISVIGRPAILVPFEAAANDHQSANAHHFSQKGGGILIREGDFSPQSCADALLSIIEAPTRGEQMAKAAFGQACVEATQRLADLVTAVAMGKRVTHPEKAWK